MAERIYLDWNATTPLDPAARDAMAEAMAMYGNPSSVHAEGRAARKLVDEARIRVANAVGAEARQVIFTSGGTEANALALTPGQKGTGGQPLQRLIVSAVEHPSVLAGGRFPAAACLQAPVTAAGAVDLTRLEELLTGQSPALVSIMAANNETGVIQPISEASRLVHAAGGLLHVDAVQALGRLPLELGALGADLISLSAHKVGGPKGVGALVLAPHIAGPNALLGGGGQERGRRAGTENVIGLAGFGAAVEAAMAARDREAGRLAGLQRQLETALGADAETVVFGRNVPRLANTTLAGRAGLKAETLVIAFDLAGFAVSSGSACSSGKVQPSHVLAAMGVAPELARSAIRISMGRTTQPAEIERFAAVWREVASGSQKK